MIYTAGIDVGSTYTKAVILSDDDQVVGRGLLKTGFRLTEAGERALQQALRQAHLDRSDLAYLATTGYGRFQISARNINVTDLTAAARGARFLFPRTQTILDVGGQTMKASRLRSRKSPAMPDFGPVLSNPSTCLLGAAGQFGNFLTLALALALGFPQLDAVSIGIIGACDGPTAIYVTSKFAPHLLGAVSGAAYSYMSLVPVIQPPIMKLLTTEKERNTIMPTTMGSVSKTTKLLFPLVITVLGGLIAPKGLPLLGTIMLGNLMRESGVVSRLTKASENEIANVVTLFLGLSIGATMVGEAFLRPQTLIILCLGFIAICLDTVCGICFGKVMRVMSGGKINPLIGAAGISAFPMAARVVQKEGQKYNKWTFCSIRDTWTLRSVLVAVPALRNVPKRLKTITMKA